MQIHTHTHITLSYKRKYCYTLTIHNLLNITGNHTHIREWLLVALSPKTGWQLWHWLLPTVLTKDHSTVHHQPKKRANPLCSFPSVLSMSVYHLRTAAKQDNCKSSQQLIAHVQVKDASPAWCLLGSCCNHTEHMRSLHGEVRARADWPQHYLASTFKPRISPVAGMWESPLVHDTLFLPLA